MRPILAALAFALLATASAVADPLATPTRAFMNTNCKQLTNACTDVITKALTTGRDNGKIPAKCFQNRPPLPPQALDIALWLISHRDLDSKPISEAAIVTAERLWPCAKAT